MNYLPSSMLFSLDATERGRMPGDRPASRAEILTRHLRVKHLAIAPQERIRAARIAYGASRYDERPSLLLTATRARRSIGRALAAAGHRLDREAA